MIIAVTNLKGGVGKTTIATNLAVCFATIGKSVCIIDTDEQQSSSGWASFRTDDLPSVIVTGATNAKVALKTIKSIGEKFDIVIVDGTPSLSEMTTTIIMASDLIITPVKPSPYDFSTIPYFLERLEQAKAFRGEIPVYFVLNQFNAQINIHRGLKSKLPEFGIPVLESEIATRTAYTESVTQGKGVIEWGDEKADIEFKKLTNEIIGIIKNLQK